jgi:acetyl-CoA carboxylase biotin carboxylase subunit
LRRAILEYEIGGIRTNRAFFGEIMDDAAFRAGALSTAFLDEFMARRQVLEPTKEVEAVAALAAVLAQNKSAARTSSGSVSRWSESGRESLLR